MTRHRKYFAISYLLPARSLVPSSIAFSYPNYQIPTSRIYHAQIDFVPDRRTDYWERAVNGTKSIRWLDRTKAFRWRDCLFGQDVNEKVPVIHLRSCDETFTRLDHTLDGIKIEHRARFYSHPFRFCFSKNSIISGCECYCEDCPVAIFPLIHQFLENPTD